METVVLKLINDVKAIILRHVNPERIYLYGSYANGEASKGSDIDIAYDAENFNSNHLIKNEIDQINTLVKIDIQNIAKAEERFKNRVKSTGKVLYSSTKKLRAEDGLHNFSNAFNRYESVVNRELDFKNDGFGDVYLDLVVKRFEFTYEMAWKAVKRYLDFQGIEVKSPRAVFQEAYSQGLIENESVWLEMIEQRNLSSHIYDEFQISEILDRKEKYLKAFSDLKSAIESGLK